MGKIKITDEVANFCIKNKLTIGQGLIKLIDNKFISLDKEIKEFKTDVRESMAQIERNIAK